MMPVDTDPGVPVTDPTGKSHKHTNRLSLESSPYLLQHAHNPVDWYAWGEEAFKKARREDKPIFLSVGYSTCYWCHVMERQSFEVEAVAAEMNRLCVNIKVDREERPDVDQLYMTAVQLITRHGGWPMSVWLTPDLKPFYGGTYYPPSNFVSYLRALEDKYRNSRGEVDATAGQIVSILQRLARPVAPEKPLTVDLPLIHTLIGRTVSDYDSKNGGFGGAPKFPRQTALELLLVYLAGGEATDGDADFKSQILKQLRHSLDAMAAGGIRDQLGGAFHRYSTDARWLVPHFEIMLYDNAMLGWIYAEAYRQTKEHRYADVARGIFDFVLREMTSPDGAFYTAFDAEVDAREGMSYLWTSQQIEAILGREDARLFNRVYGVDAGPNFADPHHGNGTPDTSILYMPESLEMVAAATSQSPAELERRLSVSRGKLYEARRRRIQPLLDTKIITSWNALMIRALAHGGRVLNERRYVDASARAADFLLRKHLIDGVLYRTSRDGKTKHHAFLDDYAFLAQALLALRGATGVETWKGHAAAVAVQMLQKFIDEEGAGFYFNEAGATDVIVRQKAAQDSPLPSGNAVAAMVLLELGQAKGCLGTLAAFAQQMADQGESMSSMVQAAMLYLRSAEPFTVSASPVADADDRPATPQQIAAGVVAVRTEWLDPTLLRVVLSVLDGFHINAHDTHDPSLIPTRLAVEGASVEYPPGEERRFVFHDAPIRVYAGDVTLLVRLTAAAPSGGGIGLALTYQACNESACFPPVIKNVKVEVR